MNNEPRTFKEILDDQGYYNKWHAQVMSDILLPVINDHNPPEDNGALLYYKFGESTDQTPVSDHMLGLYLVREVFRNLGLTSTDKIFEQEAGIAGTEQRFADNLRERFENLAMTTKEHVQPPLLSQILYMIQLHKAKEEQCNPDMSEFDVRFGIPVNAKTRNYCPRVGDIQAEEVPIEECDYSDDFNWKFNLREWLQIEEEEEAAYLAWKAQQALLEQEGGAEVAANCTY